MVSSVVILYEIFSQNDTEATRPNIHLLEMRRRCFHFADNIADNLTVFLNALKQRWPSHQVGEVEVQIIVFRVGIEVAEVEVEEVGRLNSADGRHGREQLAPPRRAAESEYRI